MPLNPQEETHITRYLLGELSEDERTRLEESFFDDDEQFEQLLAVEDDLIDACARGELSAAERARFEQLTLASHGGRERLLFARALTGALSDAAPVPTPAATPTPARAEAPIQSPKPSLFAALGAGGPWLRFAAVAAAVALVVVVPWLLVERARTRDEVRRLREETATLRARAEDSEREAAAARARNEELLARLEEAGDSAVPSATPGSETNPTERTPPEVPTGPSQPTVVAFALSPGLVRGGGATTLSVPASAASVRLTPNVAATTYESFRAVIQTAGGREVWRTDAGRPRRNSVQLPAVPARALPPGDYVLLLSGRRADGGIDPVAEYSFRIMRR